ncbi:MAG: Rne/Rng family ribonuclease [Proteobacteria bacterium]|nr:Rne/Rng family ribonuclease [Pseudomonadota bacterium]
MTTDLIINARSHEIRIALIENGTVIEFYIERPSIGGITGNIYKGRIVRVLPGMQAAFVDIGQVRAAFLHVDDVYDHQQEFEQLLRREEDEGLPNEEPEGTPDRHHYTNGFQIEDLLHQGQEILVQVSKEPMGHKGARVTSHISLPGRHLVLMPTASHIGVSRRIEDEEERRRLREAIQEARPDGSGFIARTAAEGVQPEKIVSEMSFMLKLWQNIKRKSQNAAVPSLIHQELDATLRAVRDLFTEEVDRLIIDSLSEYDKVLRFIETFSPGLKSSVELYSGREPVFDAYGVEVEVARALAKKVWLKSGGYIVIEATEALTSIDVNTGRYVGQHNLEETIVKTNLEAVKEIAYQLRLRNIGGLIVIDFIDMEREPNREKVFTVLKEALSRDKSKTKVLRMSELGLIEMTRKRTREDIDRYLREPCYYCEGEGYLLSRTSTCYEAFRDLEREAMSSTGDALCLTVHPALKELMLDEERHAMDDLESRLGKRVIIRSDDGLHLTEYRIESE